MRKASREQVSDEVVDSEAFFDGPDAFAPTAFAAGEGDAAEPAERFQRPVWTKIQFGLAALSATPLLFIGGLGGWPWDSDQASAENTAPLAAGQQHYPVSVTLDRLDIEVPTDALRLDPRTNVLLPPAFGRAGWYEAGPEPGELGRAVILGRRSADGADAFGRLVDTRVGDRIVVGTAGGTELTFVVRSVRQYRADDVPVDRVYGGPKKEAQLRLVSSAGPYDATTATFPRNVVVYADLLPE